MGPGQMGQRNSAQRDTGHYVAQATGRMRVPKQSAPLGEDLIGWDARLYPGLRVTSVPSQIRAALAQALGEMGVEAEFFLVAVDTFPAQRRYTHAQGETFLRQLEASGQRIAHAAATLEVATQSYLTALAAAYPDLRTVGESDDVWWPPFAGYELNGEPLEQRFRRCGFAYRHVYSVYLSTHVEAIAEQLALTLYALSSLPPAGVAPMRALYQGLYELSSALQGDVVAHHITGVSARYPGLLASVARLRALDAEEDTSLDSDLAWAHTQYAQARNAYANLGGASANTHDARAWAAQAAQEWRQVVGFLDYLRVNMPINSAVRR